MVRNHIIRKDKDAPIDFTIPSTNNLYENSLIIGISTRNVRILVKAPYANLEITYSHKEDHLFVTR